MTAARAVIASLQETGDKATATLVGAALRLLRLAEDFRRLHTIDIPLFVAAIGIGITHQLTAGGVVAVGGRMWCETVFGEHIAAAAALGVDQIDAFLIPTNIAAVRLNRADFRAARGVLASWLCMHDKTAPGRRLACGIRRTETSCGSDTGRVPVHTTAKRITVADTVAAGRRITPRCSMNNETALRLSSTTAGTGHPCTELQRLTDALHVPNDVATVRIELAHDGAALRIITERSPMRQAAIASRWTAARQIRTKEPGIVNACLIPAHCAARGIDHTDGLAALWVTAVRKW